MRDILKKPYLRREWYDSKDTSNALVVGIAIGRVVLERELRNRRKGGTVLNLRYGRRESTIRGSLGDLYFLYFAAGPRDEG
jgi:hypothetical protein